MKKPTTKVSIHSYGRGITKGLKLIDRFKQINNLQFDLEIKLDFQEPDLGYFNYDPKEKVIFINPIRCSNKPKKNDMEGNPKDNSIHATICHEFGHFLDLKLRLLAEYRKKDFTLKSLIMTKWGKKHVIEELADLITLYLTNPYCLKLIDKERFMWIKSKFKSPSPCGKKFFINCFCGWKSKARKKFRDTYGIYIVKDEIVINKSS